MGENRGCFPPTFPTQSGILKAVFGLVWIFLCFVRFSFDSPQYLIWSSELPPKPPIFLHLPLLSSSTFCFLLTTLKHYRLGSNNPPPILDSIIYLLCKYSLQNHHNTYFSKIHTLIKSNQSF